MSKGEIIPESAVRFVRDFDAPPSRVWAFLTDSRLLPEWYGDGAIEPREGGKVSLMAGHIQGVVTGWRPEKFLAYTWNVFEPGESAASSGEAVGQTKVSKWPVSYLEFTLEDSRLTLVHRPIPEPMHKLTMIGWHTMLDMIGDGLKGQFPPRTEVMPRSATLYGVDLNALKR
ncbi:MAG TPA: SRPBCC domain-containing protein [Rhizomicrobium sp.]|jgi:uncharacterized protein YndB with AHSA1/START domain